MILPVMPLPRNLQTSPERKYILSGDNFPKVQICPRFVECNTSMLLQTKSSQYSYCNLIFFHLVREGFKTPSHGKCPLGGYPPGP